MQEFLSGDIVCHWQDRRIQARVVAQKDSEVLIAPVSGGKPLLVPCTSVEHVPAVCDEVVVSAGAYQVYLDNMIDSHSERERLMTKAIDFKGIITAIEDDTAKVKGELVTEYRKSKQEIPLRCLRVLAKKR